MILKGGVAYIDMKNNVVTADISAGSAVYIEGLYANALKAVTSNKIVALCRLGNLGNIIIVPQASMLLTNQRIFIRYTFVNPTSGGVFEKTLIILNTDTYYIVS